MKNGLIKISLLVLLLLAQASPASSQIVLRMVGIEDIGGAWGEVIDGFHRENPDIKIEYIAGPWSTQERENMYIRSFLGGAPFDLVYMDVTWTAKFAEKGWLLPLDPWFAPDLQSEFLPGDVQAGYYNGRIYRVPVRSDVGVLYYRKDIIPEPPRTWEDFERLCEKYSNPPELYGIVFQGMQYEGLVCNYLEYLWGAGGTVLDREGNVRLDSPENRRALGFMKNIIDKGWAPQSVVTFQEQHSLEFFAQGKALFMRNWPYAWNILRDSPLRGKVGIAPLIHDEGREPVGTLGGWGLGIARQARHPDAAWKFIAFASSPESQKILHFRRGALPARKSLFKDEEILRESPHYPDLYRIVQTARPRPVHPDYSRISAILQKHVSAVLIGKESPEQASLAMDRQTTNALASEKTNWFKRLFMDPDLNRTLKNTALFTGISVPFEFMIGLLIALLINAPLKGKVLSRVAILVPWALPTAVMALAWQWMFNNPFGVVNDLLMKAGVLSTPLDWLSSPAGAMFVAIFADVWKTTPFVVIILLAGLQSIPGDLYESLSLDGAGPVKTLFHLTLPMLMPFIRVALIFRIIHAAGIFDLIWVLTKGGPADGTRTLGLYIFDLAFRHDEIGYGVFLTVLFMAALMLITFVIMKVGTLKHERVGR